MTNWRSTTVISSLSSVCPAISRSTPPQAAQVRSDAASSCTMSMRGSAGWAFGPWPRWGGAAGAGTAEVG